MMVSPWHFSIKQVFSLCCTELLDEPNEYKTAPYLELPAMQQLEKFELVAVIWAVPDDVKTPKSASSSSEVEHSTKADSPTVVSQLDADTGPK
jgi:hypothetical protein